MNIVIPDFVDTPETIKDQLRQLGATIYDDTPGDEQTIIKRIKEAEIITANYIDITPSIIDNAPKLKYIVVPAVGYEWVEHKLAASKGIKVINCPTHNSHAVAEHALALMLACTRRIPQAVKSLSSGAWNPKDLQGTEIKGKKLGIIGYGRIGKDIDNMAKALGMHASFANTKSSSSEIDEIFRESDTLCLVLPLNDSTHQLVDERRLRLLKPSATFINVGRGATVDQGALFELLKTGKIASAGLDVYEDEPLTGTPNDKIVALAGLPNVVATPHIGYNTKEAADRLGEELLQNIQSCLSGNPVNIVN